jgi:thiol-disulfide isomerase/thioredoxin
MNTNRSQINLIFLSTFVILIFGCSKSNQQYNEGLKNGIWRALILEQGQTLPFNFEVKGTGDSTQIFLMNAEERILVDEMTFWDDSVRMEMHIFDTEIVAKIMGDSLIGYYNKRYEPDHILPFVAYYGQNFRFPEPKNTASSDVSGKWEATFTKADGSTYPSVGEFQQIGNRVTGTFLTQIGDYRYLDGIVDGTKLQLSAFDGNHLFLFVAELAGDSLLSGDFWHGKTVHETWTATKNDSAQLIDADSLTYLKPGYTKLEFSFPNTAGDTISLTDAQFENQVVIVQIFGTWCPNCMDETRFLTEWYDKNKDKGVSIVGLAYEMKEDFDYATKRINKVKSRLEVPYEMLFAGSSDKIKAAATLPMLNHIISFPTTIFIDRKGNIRKIHTGFSGPGTGIHFEEFTADFEKFTAELIAE